MLPPLHHPDLQRAEELALSWVVRAIAVSGNTGVAHSRHMLLPSCIAWAKPYPETTGYFLENLCLFNRNDALHSFDYGIRAAEWLCQIQHPEGWWGSGLSNKKESFFNTSQILFGLQLAWELTQNHKFFIALEKAYHRLIHLLQNPRSFNEGLYVKSFLASYYARALWPILKINQIYFNHGEAAIIKKTISDLYCLKNAEFGFSDAGFYPHKNYLSHTIAYTYEGFLEITLLLGDCTLQKLLTDELSIWAQHALAEKNIYGHYDANYQPDRSFAITSGIAQFASLFLKAFQINHAEIFLDAARLLIVKLMKCQIVSGKKDLDGSFPASLPLYKNYFPFRVVNWTNKFFLDACHHYRSVANF